MYTNKPPVPLNRSFSQVTNQKDQSDERNWEEFFSLDKSNLWGDLEREYRCVILAEAGAGKTHEMRTRAKQALAHGKTAFFIRIENIESDFEDEFEVGTEEEFEEWLDSDQEAWFYLDSVDEARLASPKAFEKAIKCFSKRIKSALQRTHIFVSSRPYAWRNDSDRRLLEEKLPYLQPSDNAEQAPPSETELQENTSQDEEALKVYYLNALSTEDIRLFADHRKTKGLDQLMDSLERSNLTSMAERPFDLDVILDKWQSDKELGQRLEMLQHSIQRQLKEIDTDRAESQPLHLDTALKGARLIAAAVALTGEPGIKVPGSPASDGITASELLGPTWPDQDVRALLERGIFNDVLYGHVRFRHREIRDLLAAEWFHDQLIKGASRRKIEHLFFAEQYGEQVIRPRLRSVLVWLAILDADIRHKATAIAPEIVTEGGDPVCLPYPDRQKILIDIVHRIAADKSTQDVRDNSSIARIALPDLSETTLQLIEQYNENSEVIWFLGRLVWQGQMTNCLTALFDIALDAQMDTYARYASVRAVMTCGTQEQADLLWQQLNQLPTHLNPKLLAEVVETAQCSLQSVNFLLESIEKLESYQPYDASFDRLSQSLHRFIDRFLAPTSNQLSGSLSQLISGLNLFLEQEPHIDKRDCTISQKYRWLLSVATHAVERLVSARSHNALNNACLAVLSKAPNSGYWGGVDENEYQKKLESLIPQWHEMNDALFWYEIEKERTLSEKPVISHWNPNIYRQFDRFGSDRFFDVLRYIERKPSIDDKHVALSLAYSIFEQSNRPETWLEALQKTVSGSQELESSLDELINPVISESVRLVREETERKRKERKREGAVRKQEEEKQHVEWVDNLRANPEQLEFLPDDLEALTNNHIWLMCEVDEPNSYINKETLYKWMALIPEFGEQVAETYRKIAIQQWRRITPEIRSEGGDTTSWPYALMLAFAGLEIEFRETENFVQNLSETDAQHVLRYWFRDLDNLQLQMESVYKKFPSLVLDAVWKELQWELENTSADKTQHYILGNLELYATWLIPKLSSPMFQWLEQNNLKNPETLKQCISLTLIEDIEPNAYVSLIKTKVSESEEITAIWYALWLLIEANTAIPALKNYLAALPQSEATQQAQFIITHMFDTRRSDGLRSLDVIPKPDQLKHLYLLMHRYIKKSEDIIRRGRGAYRPGLRDDAQDAREAILNRLTNTSGKDTFLALTQLSNEHPVEKSRTWMKALAYKRAERDSELDLMSAQQVREFSELNSITPTSHKQLFDLTVDQLLDLKDWLEQGNDSPYNVWQKAAEETEVRNLFAGQLNKMALGRYNCTQENELANGQRPDLLMTSNQVSPVPVELKVLDKGWSGAKLCERLRNQLAGDYLREEEARCGVFLLVWQGVAKRSVTAVKTTHLPLTVLRHFF